MKEIDRLFFSQSMAWREGFFYAIQYRGSEDVLKECLDDLVAAEKEFFAVGWEYATNLRKAHNKALNES